MNKLNPFFSFYGSKWRDTPRHYPEPRHKTIIEPFAGSAGYALNYPDRRVLLYDIDPVIAGVWGYLIRAKPREILRLPDVPEGCTVNDLRVCPEAKALIGFWLNRGTSKPSKSPSKWMRSGLAPSSFWGEQVRRRISSQVDFIKHWQVFNRSYEACPQLKATWFVDAPYQVQGYGYAFNQRLINFGALAAWCRSRKGQVIVCENAGAIWLPFEEVGEVKAMTVGRKSREAVWLNDWEAA